MRWYRVTAGDMGSLEVFLTTQQQRWYDLASNDAERKDYIAHVAWQQLWQTDGAKMLQNLCDNLGVDRVKRKFSDNITIEEIK